MFSKALFKQSMKANWVKWTCVTIATCVMLAIVIIVLGSLAIDNIRGSLKNVFQQANQEATLKESVVDSYELYLNTMDFEVSLNSMNNFLTNISTAVENTYNGDREATVESLYSSFGNYTSMFNFSESELRQFLTIVVIAYENDASITVTTLEKAYAQYVYETALETYMQEEDATIESATANAISAKTFVESVIAIYNNESYTYDENTIKSEATEFVLQVIYDQVYEMYITDGTEASEEEILTAKMYAVSSKVIASNAITTYEIWITEYTNLYPNLDEDSIKEYAREQATASLSEQIDEDVAAALQELGNMDIYGLIIGNIFYRIAGILLPMVYVIMVANGLLAGQVDSGSMAYVLSTPTKRRTVTVTQMIYLILSLLAMFVLVTVVSVISVWIVGGNDFTINFAEILLLNLGAYLTMFAFAGFCFMCSSIFNRSKYSLSIGGGISIFMLVCTILGLFGSSVVPSAMRIDQMNFFNYLSIITLFDATSILSGGLVYLWKFSILALIGIVTFIVGVFAFEKKDLPL